MDKKVIVEKPEMRFKRSKATLPSGKTVHFGDKRYQQHKNSTPLNLYSNLNHNDEKIKRAIL